MSGAVKHTPGPWRYSGRLGHGYLIDPNVAVAYGGLASGKTDQGEANAQLIAAAPDMLVALRCARADCYMPPHVAAHVDAAIARAEGRS